MPSAKRSKQLILPRTVVILPLTRTTTLFKTSIIYVREVIKKGDIYTNKIVSLGLEDHGGVYAENCN